MDNLTVRLSDDQSGYEINHDGELMDFVSMRELTTYAGDPHTLMRERIRNVGKRMRVRRFVERLES